MRRIVAFSIIIVLLSTLLPWIVRWYYSEYGFDDPFPVFLMVVVSGFLPILSPLLVIKEVLFNYFIPEGIQQWIVHHGGSLILTPSVDFNKHMEEALRTTTNYSDLRNWVCFGDKTFEHDACSLYPADALSCADLEDKELCDSADIFYLAPTTFYSPSSWNAPVNNSIVQYLLRDAITVQQASAFNIVGKIYSPIIRQATAAVFLLDDFENHPNFQGAISIAYSDVQEAFREFIKYREASGTKKGIVLAGHSQGSVLLEKILQQFFVGKPLSSQLIVAYLIGWSISHLHFPHTRSDHLLHTCSTADDTRCVVSWRTFARGGDSSRFLHVRSKADSGICVNPLSWSTNSSYMSQEHNLGGIDLIHFGTMWNYLKGGSGMNKSRNRVVLPSKTGVKSLADAQCLDGNLYVNPPSLFGNGWMIFPSWRFATFPGRNLHTYDYNLFFHNLRENVVTRVKAFKIKK